MDNYYVYEWARLDTNEVFYVGKGKGSRFNNVSKRSPYFKRVYHSTACVVRKIAENLSEAESFLIEIATISFHKSQGQASCNFTDGGEGSSGLIHSKETKAKISLAKTGTISPKKGIPTGKPAWNTGKPMSEEAVKNNSIAQAGKILSAEHRAAISAGGKGKVLGPKSEEHKAKLRLANIGKKASEEAKQKMTATQKERWAKIPKKTHCNHGHEFTEENTYVGKLSVRACRICLKEANRKHREKIATLLVIKPMT